MKVLVTGASGFIGAALCRALIERGDEVFAFHRPTSNLRLLEDLPVTHVLGDLTQFDTIQSAVHGMQIVFHAAAMLGASDKPGLMYAVTVEGTRAILQAALEARVERVVHTSSVAALGVPELSNDQSYGLLDECHTWNFRPDFWPYGYAKYLAELEVQKAVADGLDVVITNPAAVFGPGDLYRQTSSIIVQVAHRRVPLAVEGGINVVHLADVIDGHLAALDRGRRGERYILGGQNMSLREFLRKIALCAGVPAPAVELPAGLVTTGLTLLGPLRGLLELPVSADEMHLAGFHFYYDSTKARTELGLAEARTAEQAIQDAYDWFVEAGAIGKK